MSDTNAALKPLGRSGIGRYKEENVNKFPYEAFTTSVNTSYPRTLTVQSNWNFAVTGDIYNVHDTESIDISSGNQNIDLDDFSGKSVGYIKEYIVSGGDGTYTCTTTNNGSFTLDGVALSSLSLTFQGQGRVVWQLVATNTLRSRGPDIWDSDGGNFSLGKFEKYLSGKALCYEDLTGLNATTVNANSFGSTAGNMYFDNNSITFPITFVAPPNVIGSTNSRSLTIPTPVTTSGFSFRPWSTSSLSGSMEGFYQALGRWTTSFPL